ncbi:polyprenyl synthetase family protein [uncultured Weeksella sp.]|uniref:polyprenyl synthetase family protein n=1 Tax=uncultured Weeksella sp. TaxID=1161389 RepID=UPI00259B7FAB|nr:polyprenyl synthetase family protein [uncultured Weeksella sp.]
MHSIEELHEIIDQAIEKNLDIKSPRELYEPIEYILGIGGKRIRPLIVLMGNQMFNGLIEDAVKPAIAMEYFHNFTLMHDDIMDSAPLRRGKEAVHIKYGINSAILSGDTMLIRAYELLEDLPNDVFKEAIRLFNKTAIELCEGQQYDVNYETQKEISFEDYYKMIKGKTAVLVGACLKLGALIAGAPKEEADRLYEIGLNLGIAYQLKDDYLDVFGTSVKIGKKHAGDIYENKKTILFVTALQNADAKERDELLYWYNIKAENIDKVYAVEKLYRKLKVNKQIAQLIKDYTKKAKQLIDEVAVTEEKKYYLRELSEMLIDRQE